MSFYIPTAWRCIPEDGDFRIMTCLWNVYTSVMMCAKWEQIRTASRAGIMHKLPHNVPKVMKEGLRNWGGGETSSPALSETLCLPHCCILTVLFCNCLWRVLMMVYEYSTQSLDQLSRLRFSKRPNWVGASLPSPEDGSRSSFRNVVFSGYIEFRAMDKVHKPDDSEYLK
jgi:hypothetical protein